MPRRILEGKVVSDKQDKTITVSVERRMMHPIYKKYLKKSAKFAAHDETNSKKVGDTVQIIECAPISKNKRFTVYTGQGADSAATAPKAETKKPVAKATPKKPAEEKKETAKKSTAKKAAPKKTAAKKED
jgi:small subunit ribosomal protein S17